MSNAAKHPGYKVTAALVIAADVQGKLTHRYRDAWIPWLNDVQRAHFLRHGLVVELQAGEATPSPEPATAPAAPDSPAASSTPAAKPAKTAPDEAWIEYGVGQGHDRDELAKLSKTDLRDLLG